MPAALLLAEPEPEARDLLERRLTGDGFAVVGVAAGCEALDLAERARPDLVLLANALPDLSAPEVCDRLRSGEPGRAWNRDVPVIVLGSSDVAATERLRAFDRGCDDYVSEPIAYAELVARIRAILRRAAALRPERLEVRELVVDRRTRRVTVAGEPVALAGKEYELLLMLASEPARVFTKAELLREVWGFRTLVPTRTLDSHASRLRRKLARPGSGPFVVNVWGVGYSLTSEDRRAGERA